MYDIRAWPIVAMLIYGASAEPARQFTFVITSLKCSNFSAIAKIFECSVRQQATNVWIFEQRVMFSLELHKFEVRQRIEIMLLYAKTTLKVLDLRIDVCQGLDVVWRTPLLRVLLSELRRTSNIPSACPWKANKLYSVHNFTVTSAFFPAYTPDADFTSITDYFEDNDLFATQIEKGRISSKRFGKAQRNKHV